MGKEDACISLTFPAQDLHLHEPPGYDAEIADIISDIEESTTRVQKLARRLSEISSAASDETAGDFAAWVSAEYARRRKRGAFFPADLLLGEPGWDLLLDLAAQRCRGKHISITSACIAACVPNTTALRWIAILEQQGLIERCMDAVDKRRTLVAITDAGFAKLMDYYRSVARPQLRTPSVQP